MKQNSNHTGSDQVVKFRFLFCWFLFFFRCVRSNIVRAMVCFCCHCCRCGFCWLAVVFCFQSWLLQNAYEWTHTPTQTLDRRLWSFGLIWLYSRLRARVCVSLVSVFGLIRRKEKNEQKSWTSKLHRKVRRELASQRGGTRFGNSKKCEEKTNHLKWKEAKNAKTQAQSQNTNPKKNRCKQVFECWFMFSCHLVYLNFVCRQIIFYFVY